MGSQVCLSYNDVFVAWQGAESLALDVERYLYNGTAAMVTVLLASLVQGKDIDFVRSHLPFYSRVFSLLFPGIFLVLCIISMIILLYVLLT